MALARNFSDGSNSFAVRDGDTRSALVNLCAVLIGKGAMSLTEVPANIRAEVSEVIG